MYNNYKFITIINYIKAIIGCDYKTVMPTHVHCMTVIKLIIKKFNNKLPLEFDYKTII